jgi:hypothetical protein
MAPEKEVEKPAAGKTAEKEVDGRRPEDHRRPPKRDMPYPLSSYSLLDGAKILVQKNKVLAASLVSSLFTQVTLVGLPFPGPVVAVRILGVRLIVRRCSIPWTRSRHECKCRF